MNKMIDYPLYHKPMDIKNVLTGVASQENCDGPEYDLMMEAAKYIQVLETLLDIYVTYSWPQEYGASWMKDWKRFAKQQKDLSPDFIKIVEENFWELLA